MAKRISLGSRIRNTQLSMCRRCAAVRTKMPTLPSSCLDACSDISAAYQQLADAVSSAQTQTSEQAQRERDHLAQWSPLCLKYGWDGWGRFLPTMCNEEFYNYVQSKLSLKSSPGGRSRSLWGALFAAPSFSMRSGPHSM